jgi:heptosyltransferase I
MEGAPQRAPPRDRARPTPDASIIRRSNGGRMSAILVVRPSSLGDIVHALALVADVRQASPGVSVDWVAEEAFAPLVALDPGIHRVIPVALRRWRAHMLAASTWREMARFRNAVRRDDYVAVLDLQEQVKGAAIAAIARGPRHGPDRASIREPIATLAHNVHHAIDPNQHLIDRCRQLAAAALGYPVDGPPRFGLIAPAPSAGATIPDRPYLVLVHSTSRENKLWPEANWRALISAFARSGFAILLPWGDASERARSERLAADESAASVPSRQSLPALASLLARAELVVGVDTGLVHLAAALGTPTVSLFIATDPRLAGVGRANRLARDVGGIGEMPSADTVVTAAGALLRRVPSC